jgi:hypothetical protein
MATIKDFLYFLKERESIRLKKLNGKGRPWTEDIILGNCRFTNIDRVHDRGTQLLISFTNGMGIKDKLIYSTLYRSCYSSPLLLDKLTGNIKEDLIILSGNQGLVGSRIPYQIFLKKEETIHSFLINTAYKTAIDFIPIFNQYDKASLEEGANDIALLFKKYHNKRLIFLGTEIAKDLSYFYPGKINPDSKCPMNTGAKSALRVLKVPVAMLCKITGMSENSVEHSLCEFSKYLDRKEYYRETGELKKVWLYYIK